MGCSLSVSGYLSKNNPDYQKHFKAVKFCIENNLSFPKETSEFFKGSINGDDLEDYKKDSLIELIENGKEVEIPVEDLGYEQRIKVSDIPHGVDMIIVKWS